MSSPNPDVAVSTISKYVNGPVKNNTLTKWPLYWWIDKKGKTNHSVGGVNIQPQAHAYQVQSPTRWSRGYTGTFPDPVNFRSPTHNWGGYIVQYFIYQWDVLENQAGDTRRFDRKAKVLELVKKAWMPFYETKFWLDETASSPTGLGGLPAFMKASTTYGGLTQNATTHPAWTPTRLDGTTTGITGKTFANDPIAILRRLINTHSQKGASTGLGITDRPSVGFTTMAMFEHLLAYHTAKAFTPVTVKTDEVGFSFANVVELNIPIYWSPSATSAQLQLLNPEDMVLDFQTDEDIKVRMSEPDQPIGQVIQLYNKLCFYCENPYNQAQLHTSGVT